MLSRYVKTATPSLVVDIGCGTGLSTRYWADRTARVIGVDPSAEMLRWARKRSRGLTVSYVAGLGEGTGLAGGHADIVTYSDSLHWMEPEPTLAEAARLLRPGGVLAAFYHNQYPSTSNWEGDRMIQDFRERVTVLDAKRGITAGMRRWPREEHLSLMKESGLFRHLRELSVHHVDEGNAERLIGLAMSDGFVRGLMKAGVGEDELGLSRFRSEASGILGEKPQPWFWTISLWIGVV